MKRRFILRRSAAKAELQKEPKRKAPKNPSAKGVSSVDGEGAIINFEYMDQAGRSLLTAEELKLEKAEIAKVTKRLSKRVADAIKSGEPFMDLSWSKAD